MDKVNVDRVVFLKSAPTEFDKDGEVFAFFPDLKWDNQNYTAYAHCGQHGACSVAYAKSCKAAVYTEYMFLEEELCGIGYTLNVINADKWLNEK